MAILDQQIGEAALGGGVSEQASTAPTKPERILVASAGSVFNQFIRQASKVPTRATRTADDEQLAVPTGIEERGTRAGEYTERQREIAPDVLSEEGQKRFEDAGGSATTATELPPEGFDPTDLEMSEGAPTPTRGEVQAEQIVETGQKATRDFSTGAVPEGQAIDLLQYSRERELVIDTDKGIDFNFNNIEDDQDIQVVINATSEMLADPIDAAKRGIIPNADTLQNAAEKLADDMKFSREVLKKKSGTALNAEEMTAVRILLTKSAKNLAVLAQKITDGDNSTATLLEFRKKMALHNAIQLKAKGFQTEIARALQAFRIPVGPSVDVEELSRQTIGAYGGTELNAKMAKAYLVALRKGGTKEANDFVAKGALAKGKDIIHHIYINGLLSWPTTAVKNALGTPTWAAYNEVADLISAVGMSPVRAGQRLMGRTPDPEGLYFDDLRARWFGYRRAFIDAFLVAGETFKTGQQSSLVGGKLDLQPEQIRPLSAEALGITDKFAGPVMDILARIISAPGDVLGSTDDAFKTIFTRGALYEEAHRQARRSQYMGKSREEALDDGMMVLLDPRAVSEQTADFAKYNTLTSDITGTLGTITRSVQQHFLGRFILPFATVPTNSIRVIAEGHPIAALLSKEVQANLLGKNGPKIQQRAMSRMALGTGLMMTVGGYAQEGRITGAMPKDAEARKALPPNWQPYSFVMRGEGFPVGEDGNPLPVYDDRGIPNGPLVYVSYQGLEPVSAFLGIAADTVSRMNRYDDPENRQNILTASVMATFNYYTQVPFLEGLAGVFKGIEYDDFSQIYKGPAQNFVGPVPLPFVSVLRNVSGQLDPTIKRVTPDISYYSEEDVRAIYEEEVAFAEANNISPGSKDYPIQRYELIGAVKTSNDSVFDTFQKEFQEMWLGQLQNMPWVEEAEGDYYRLLDPFGKPYERARTPFGVNPVEATWNMIMPFRINRGTELTDVQKKLMELKMPLTQMPETIEGFRLPKNVAADVAVLAKQGMEFPGKGKIEIRVPYGRDSSGVPLTFEKYLDRMMKGGYFKFSRPEQQKKQIKAMERKFYYAAFMKYLGVTENEELRAVWKERDKAGQLLDRFREMAEGYSE